MHLLQADFWPSHCAVPRAGDTLASLSSIVVNGARDSNFSFALLQLVHAFDVIEFSTLFLLRLLATSTTKVFKEGFSPPTRAEDEDVDFR